MKRRAEPQLSLLLAPKRAAVPSSARAKSAPAKASRPAAAAELLASGLTGCKRDAQDRAAAFCERFTASSDNPRLSNALCLPRVRDVFMGACDGEA